MLRANGSLLAAYPFRHSGGAISSNKWAWGRVEQRSRFDGNAVARNASTAGGTLPPGTWNMAQLPGMLSAYTTTSFAFNAGTPTVAGGVNLEGTTSITFTVPAAALQLIADLAGTGAITFTVPNATLGGAANLGGTGTITFAVPDAILGGSADLVGTGTITFSSTAVMTALAFLSGPAPDEGLTVDNIAAAVYAKFIEENFPREVWDVLKADVVVANSIGLALKNNTNLIPGLF